MYPTTWYALYKKIVDLKFPEGAIIALIKRNNTFLTPSGATMLEANDTLVVLSDNQNGLNKVEEWLNNKPAFLL